MTPEQVFALATVSVSGLFSVIVAVVSNTFTTNRENRTFQRQLHKERIELTRKLYQDTLALLMRLERSGGIGDEQVGKDLANLHALFPLTASVKIQKQFAATTEALDEYVVKYRAIQPQDIGGGMMIIKSDFQRAEKEQEVERLSEAYHEQLKALSSMMAEDLRGLEGGIK